MRPLSGQSSEYSFILKCVKEHIHILITLSGEIGKYKYVSKANWLVVKKTRVVFNRDSGTKGR